MVKIYADLVEALKRSLDGCNDVTKVPDKYLSNVIKELTYRGYFIEKTKDTLETVN